MSRRGFSVALIGCDGAGKTTVARALERESGLPVRYVYMGVSVDSSNLLLPTTRLAHAVKRARGAAARPAARGGPVRRARQRVRSLLRLANRLAEEWYRQLIAVAHMRRGGIVVFDRHFTADYHASDVAAADRTVARRVHGWLLKHAYPHPDLVIFLDAPPEVLFARKHEGTPASLARRRDEYRRFGSMVERFEVVQAGAPLEVVVGRVERIIREQGARA